MPSLPAPMPRRRRGRHRSLSGDRAAAPRHLPGAAERLRPRSAAGCRERAAPRECGSPAWAALDPRARGLSSSRHAISRRLPDSRRASCSPRRQARRASSPASKPSSTARRRSSPSRTASRQLGGSASQICSAGSRVATRMSLPGATSASGWPRFRKIARRCQQQGDGCSRSRVGEVGRERRAPGPPRRRAPSGSPCPAPRAPSRPRPPRRGG